MSVRPFSRTATASGVRAACAEKRLTTVSPGPGQTAGRWPHCSSRRVRSAASRISREPTGRSGSATAASSNRTQRAARAATVSRSYRSALYSTCPSMPSGPSCRPKARSNLAVPLCTCSVVTSSPVSRCSAVGTLFSISTTWNSGCRDRDRSGLSSSTSRSKGMPEFAYASRSARRTRSSSSANVRSPDTSVRSTTVSTKLPTSPASASSVRPASGEPITMSSPAPRRENSAARPACSTMNSEA